jgi:STE24 endopeptidase
MNKYLMLPLFTLLLFTQFTNISWAQEDKTAKEFEFAAINPDSVPSDPAKATDFYLSAVGQEQKDKAAAYFEGNYWLKLWNLLYLLGISWLLLGTKLSVKMKNLAERFFKKKFLRDIAYAIQYIIATTILGFPLSLYQGFFREHKYDLSNLAFGPWLGEEMKGLLVSLVATSLLVSLLYAILRRVKRTWWVWGTVVMVLFMVFAMLVAPVAVAPLFNKYKPLDEGPIKETILAMARSNGVPAGDVYQFDASKQSKRISANVSGLLGTVRISLNDNLLNRCTPQEIKVVMAHEMGHYVLHHVYQILLVMALLILAGFIFVDRAFAWSLRKFGAAWGITGIDDIAGLPLLLALLSVFFFAIAPVNSNLSRLTEQEADYFALNLSQEPDAFATVALKMVEYRKLEPGKLEEWLFYDHPSGKTRIYNSMRWKYEYNKVREFDINKTMAK